MATASVGQPAERGTEEEARPLFRRLLDFVFGHDFFISYAWGDAALYAEQLARRLESNGFDVFLDRDDYASGDDWQRVGSWTLRRTGQLILIGSPLALESPPVARELEIFARTGRRVVPIDFGGSLDGLADSNPMSRHLPPQLLRIREPADALASGPSDETLAVIRRTFTIVRQDKKRVRVLGVVALLLAMLAIVAMVFGVSATRSEAKAKGALAETQKARGDAERERDMARAAQESERLAKVAAEKAEKNAVRQQNIAQERQRYAELQRNAAVLAREAERVARVRADQSAREARAQADASTAYIYSDRDPTLALRLAARAADSSPNPTADLALVRAYNSGSWFYSHRLPEARDASLSVDERSIAWLDEHQLHLLDLDSGAERYWAAGDSNLQIASNGNIVTWSAWDNKLPSQDITIRGSDGAVILRRPVSFQAAFTCGRDVLVVLHRQTREQHNPQMLRIDIRTGSMEDAPLAEAVSTRISACSNDASVALVGTFDEMAILRRGGSLQALRLPSRHHAADAAINARGDWGAVYLAGAYGSETDAIGFVRLDQADAALDIVALPESPSNDSSGSVIFIDNRRVLAVSTDGWSRIIDVESHRVTVLGNQGRAADTLAVSESNGQFAVARRSGPVSLFNGSGARIGSLLGTLHSDGLNPAFRRIDMGRSGNMILTVSPNDGARLWRRPGYPLVIPRLPGEDHYERPLPEALAKIAEAPGSPERAATCGQTTSMLRDDFGLLYLCIRLNGRMDLLPTGLQDGDIELTSLRDGPLERVAVWTGDKLQRAFILEPRVILREVLHNRYIWPLTNPELDHIFEKRSVR